MTANKNDRASAPWSQLGFVLQEELWLIRGLCDAFQGLRDAVAADETEVVKAQTLRIQDVVRDLVSTRDRRRSVLGDLGGAPDLPLSELESLQGSLPMPVQRARRELQKAGRDLTQELTISRIVLGRLLKQGESFLEKVFAALGRETKVYSSEPSPKPSSSRSSVLINKVA